MKIVGIDIGGTMIKYGLISLTGEILASGEISTEADKGVENLFNKLVTIVESYSKEEILGIAVSGTGQIDGSIGKVVGGNDIIPGWIGTNLVERLENKFSLPAVLENDVNCAALGEKWLGAGRGEKDFICITIGTGIGGGVVLNNEILRGDTCVAAEFGHIQIVKDGIQCLCGKKGCYERFDDRTLNKIIDNYDNKCKECNSSACFGRICPVALEVIKLEKDKEHPYCNIMKVIDKVMKNVEDYNFFLGKLKEARFQELILTDSCNLNCKYCFQKDFHSNNVMSKETIKSFFDNVLLNSGNEKTIISLFGGEPIQSKTLDIRYYILELINNYKLNDKVILYVTSNTYNINDKEIEWINKAKKITNNNLYWQTSLDGLKEYNDQNRVTLNNKGTFDVVIKNLKTVSSLIGKDRTSINTVLTESNIEGLADWCKYLEEELLNKYIFNVTFRIDQSKNDSISLSERLKIQKAYTKVADYFKQGLISHKLVKNVFNEKVASYEDDITEQKDEFSSCGMCNNMLVVNYNGDIVPCHIFENDEKNYNDIVITNVKDMKFNNDIRKIYQTFGSVDKQYSEDKNKYCYQCPLKLSCTRCKYEHYVVNGDVSKTLKYTCQYTHHRSDIFTETGLREYFKPLTENEKEEIRAEIININNIIESGNITKEEEVELVNNLFYLQKIIEDKTWYI